MKVASPFVFAALACLSAGAAQANVPTSGLIGYWIGNGNADDSSPTANNGTFNGSYAPGPGGTGESFNLATGGVTIPNNAAYANFGAGFSAGFWFNFNGQTGTWDIIGQDVGPGGNPKWVIFYNYTAPDAFELHFNGPSFAFLAAEPVPIASGWNQFTVTGNAGDYEFYLDGSNIGSANFSGAFPAPDAPLQFGFYDGGSPFPGLLGDVVLYNRALTPDEVASLATLSSAVPESSTWAMMLAGFAVLGFAAFRKATTARAIQAAT
jgi:arabinan endo-1,5-alpha-L-arabinosidase